MAGERIGFISTGIMGCPIALNLIKADHRLTVNNRTRAKTEQLLAEGATWADCPAAL